jgi:hypothetical protein
MTKAQLITEYERLMDDLSELSTTETERLFDKIYEKVVTSRPWEHTKKEYSAVGPVAIPSDFLYLVDNNSNSLMTTDYAEGPMVFVDNKPVRVVSFSARKKNPSGSAYIDFRTNTMVFTESVSGKTVSFDYHSRMPDLALNESPFFPVHQHVIPHGMCVDTFQAMQTEKGKSYAEEHERKYNDYLGQLALWNARLIQN